MVGDVCCAFLAAYTTHMKTTPHSRLPIPITILLTEPLCPLHIHIIEILAKLVILAVSSGCASTRVVTHTIAYRCRLVREVCWVAALLSVRAWHAVTVGDLVAE